MAANIKTYDTFVPCPKVIVVKWTSEHPDYYRQEQDLFEFQFEGIPPNFGKKDPRTTEQGCFYCLPCGCEIKSVSNLKVHVLGSNHIRSARNIRYQQEEEEANAAAEN